ncbi:MAG TPA: serine hydrolase domain-containing protein [Terriglobales bacterium]|nr:serine hydrolase domain-containing protein [Terriglobales bacterium]
MQVPSSLTTAMQEAVANGVFPGAVLAVRRGEQRHVVPVGRLSSNPASAPVTPSTVYDLASLTKPLATVTSIALLVRDGRCRLEDAVATHLPECAGTPIGAVTLRHLLTHSSGLPGWRGYYERLSPDGRIPKTMKERACAKAAMLALIRDEALIYQPGLRSLYSDLGFMLLGFIVEQVSGQTLDGYFYGDITVPLKALGIEFVPAECLKTVLEMADKQGGVAPTEDDPWRGRLLCGEVHDENAAALGGVAGHAGLFGSADAVLAMTGQWLQAYLGRSSLLDTAVVRQFTTRQTDISGSTWTLGWDMPSVPSASGRYFSLRSFGHLGYTGTSIWVDPDRELEVVLLSNRVHPTRKNESIKAFRPMIHDLVYEQYVGSR